MARKLRKLARRIKHAQERAVARAAAISIGSYAGAALVGGLLDRIMPGQAPQDRFHPVPSRNPILMVPINDIPGEPIQLPPIDPVHQRNQDLAIAYHSLAQAKERIEKAFGSKTWPKGVPFMLSGIDITMRKINQIIVGKETPHEEPKKNARRELKP